MTFALLAAAMALAAATSGNDVAQSTPVLVARPLPTAPLADATLDQLRGGIRLPNGIDVNIAVRSESSVDGLLFLRSVYRIDDGGPQLQLFAPAEGQSIASRPVTTTASDGAGVAVMFDRSTGVLFVPGGGRGPNVNVSTGASPASAADDGLAALPIAPGGSLATGGGTLRLIQNAGSLQARLDGTDIGISHLFGQGFGTLIANSGNDRVIDTVTSISLDLSGTSPENLGSSLLRIEALSLDAVRATIR